MSVYIFEKNLQLLASIALTVGMGVCSVLPSDSAPIKPPPGPAAVDSFSLASPSDCSLPINDPPSLPDSRAILQAHIDAYEPLPAGTFYVASDLILSSNTTVRGAGMESTCIRAPDSANVIVGIDVKNVGVQDLTIVGGASGVVMKHVTRARLENIRIVMPAAKGINFYGAKQIMLRAIRIEGPDSYGIGFERGANQNVILSDVEIFNPRYDGIDIKNYCFGNNPDMVPAKDRCPADGSANFGFQMNNIRIRNPGDSHGGENPPSGIELRTPAVLSNIYVDKLGAGLPAVRVRADLGGGPVIVQGLHASGDGVGIWVVVGAPAAPLSVAVGASQLSTARRCVVTAHRSDPVPPPQMFAWCP